MNKNNIVLNTLVFDKQHNEGLAQTDMIAKVADFGISNIEVRREYFTDPAGEAATVAALTKQFNLKLFYSVPEIIFTNDGSLNPDLPKYFEEAKTMGVSSLKMNIGNFAAFNGDLQSALAPFAGSNIEFNVENDQGQLNGTTQNILTFLKAVKDANVDIKFVFDLGNWRFVGEDENDAAKVLAPYVRYIHVKNDILDDQKHYQVTALDEGVIDWTKTLKLLPTTVPVAIEYPASDAEITNGISLLESYKA